MFFGWFDFEFINWNMLIKIKHSRTDLLHNVFILYHKFTIFTHLLQNKTKSILAWSVVSTNHDHPMANSHFYHQGLLTNVTWLKEKKARVSGGYIPMWTDWAVCPKYDCLVPCYGEGCFLSFFLYQNKHTQNN